MSRVITAIVMLLAVTGGAVFESCYVTHVCRETEMYLQSAMESYHEQDIPLTETCLSRAEKAWNDSHCLLNSLLIHNDTETISEHITTTMDTLQYDKENFPTECHTTINAIQVIRHSMLPHMDNIL